VDTAVADLRVGDIADLTAADLPGTADLMWGSFPCQDLSLAGGRRGLNAPRSGAFWGFWNVIGKMGDRAPRTLAIENVGGLLSSHGAPVPALRHKTTGQHIAQQVCAFKTRKNYHY
jgi:DNA (cytosine-5)-methyltransferase 1